MGIESFSDDTVVELPTTTATEEKGTEGSSLDSFDNDEVIEPKPDKSQVSKLDDKEDKMEKDEEVEEKPEEEKKPEPVKQIPAGRTIRVKDSAGNAFEVSEEATVKLKVNGKNEIVQIKDLMANYSGSVAWNEKFKQIEDEKHQIKHQSQKFESERNEIVSHLTKIADMLDSEDKNPLEALHYLVDITGRDTLEFSRKVMDYLSDEVRNLDSMDEVERALYWKNKEVETIRNNQAAKAESLNKTKAERERIDQVDRLRESHGVTVEQFVQSSRELESLGYGKEQVTPQAIVNYAVMKPFYEKAELAVKDYEEDLSDTQIESLISTVANTMKNYPRISEQKALEVALESLGWEYDYEDDFKELNEKTNSAKKVDKADSYRYGSPKGGSVIETFDDFDEY